MKLPYAERRVSERGKRRRRKGGRRKERKKGSHKKEGGRGGEESAVVSLPPRASLSLDPSGVGGRERDSSHIRRRTKDALLLQFVAEERRREQRHDDDRPRKKRIHSRALLGKEKSRFRDEIGEPKKAYGLGLLPARIFFVSHLPSPHSHSHILE